MMHASSFAYERLLPKNDLVLPIQERLGLTVDVFLATNDCPGTDSAAWTKKLTELYRPWLRGLAVDASGFEEGPERGHLRQGLELMRDFWRGRWYGVPATAVYKSVLFARPDIAVKPDRGFELLTDLATRSFSSIVWPFKCEFKVTASSKKANHKHPDLDLLVSVIGYARLGTSGNAWQTLFLVSP